MDGTGASADINDQEADHADYSCATMQGTSLGSGDGFSSEAGGVELEGVGPHSHDDHHGLPVLEGDLGGAHHAAETSWASFDDQEDFHVDPAAGRRFPEDSSAGGTSEGGPDVDIGVARARFGLDGDLGGAHTGALPAGDVGGAQAMADTSWAAFDDDSDSPPGASTLVAPEDSAGGTSEIGLAGDVGGAHAGGDTASWAAFDDLDSPPGGGILAAPEDSAGGTSEVGLAGDVGGAHADGDATSWAAFDDSDSPPGASVPVRPEDSAGGTSEVGPVGDVGGAHASWQAFDDFDSPAGVGIQAGAEGDIGGPPESRAVEDVRDSGNGGTFFHTGSIGPGGTMEQSEQARPCGDVGGDHGEHQATSGVLSSASQAVGSTALPSARPTSPAPVIGPPPGAPDSALSTGGSGAAPSQEAVGCLGGASGGDFAAEDVLASGAGMSAGSGDIGGHHSPALEEPFHGQSEAYDISEAPCATGGNGSSGGSVSAPAQEGTGGDMGGIATMGTGEPFIIPQIARPPSPVPVFGPHGVGDDSALTTGGSGGSGAAPSQEGAGDMGGFASSPTASATAGIDQRVDANTAMSMGGSGCSGGSGAAPPQERTGDMGGPTWQQLSSSSGTSDGIDLRGEGSDGGRINYEPGEGHGGSGEPSSQWAFFEQPSDGVEQDSLGPAFPSTTAVGTHSDWSVGPAGSQQSGESTGGAFSVPSPLEMRGGGSGGPMDGESELAASSLQSAEGGLVTGGPGAATNLGSDDPGSTPSAPIMTSAAPGGSPAGGGDSVGCERPSCSSDDPGGTPSSVERSSPSQERWALGLGFGGGDAVELVGAETVGAGQGEDQPLPRSSSNDPGGTPSADLGNNQASAASASSSEPASAAGLGEPTSDDGNRPDAQEDSGQEGRTTSMGDPQPDVDEDPSSTGGHGCLGDEGGGQPAPFEIAFPPRRAACGDPLPAELDDDCALSVPAGGSGWPLSTGHDSTDFDFEQEAPEDLRVHSAPPVPSAEAPLRKDGDGVAEESSDPTTPPQPNNDPGTTLDVDEFEVGNGFFADFPKATQIAEAEGLPGNVAEGSSGSECAPIGLADVAAEQIVELDPVCVDDIPDLPQGDVDMSAGAPSDERDARSPPHCSARIPQDCPLFAGEVSSLEAEKSPRSDADDLPNASRDYVEPVVDKDELAFTCEREKVRGENLVRSESPDGALPKAVDDDGKDAFTDFETAGAVIVAGGNDDDNDFTDFATAVGATVAAGQEDDNDDEFTDFATAEAAVEAPVPGVDECAAVADTSPPLGAEEDEDDDEFADFSSAPMAPEGTAAEAAVQGLAAPPAAADEAPAVDGAEEDDDDEFDDFSSAPVAQEAPVPPGNETAGGTSGEGGGAVDTGGAGTPLPADGATREELAAAVGRLVERWRAAAERLEPCGALRLLGASGLAASDATGDMDWDKWLEEDPGIPGEARELLRSGVSEASVPVIPFTSLGLSSGDTDLYCHQRSKVREAFFATLGKHMQLPPAKSLDAAADPATRARASAASAAEAGLVAPLQGVALEGEVDGAGERFDVAPPSNPGGALAPAASPPIVPPGSAAGSLSSEVPSLGTAADWGLFETSLGPPSSRAPEGQGSASSSLGSGDVSGLGGDLLSQTLSDIGLGAPATPAFPSSTTSAAANASWASGFDAGGLLPEMPNPCDGAGAPQTCSAQGGRSDLPDKVRAFLDSLPDLSHLYSPVIVG